MGLAEAWICTVGFGCTVTKIGAEREEAPVQPPEEVTRTVTTSPFWSVEVEKTGLLVPTAILFTYHWKEGEGPAPLAVAVKTIVCP
jgi:hypothetical protein